MARFISVGAGYGTRGISITRAGYETEDADMLAFLRSSPDCNVFFYEVATEKELKAANIAFAKSVLGETPKVEPLQAPDLDAEEKALAEETAIKAVQAEEEAALAAEKKERSEKIKSYKSGGAKKGAPKKSAPKKSGGSK